jgi:ornithine carbamoyltransferase
MKRDFLSLNDLSPREIEAIIDRGREMKQGRPEVGAGLLNGRTMAMIFNKPSMRTRVSFEVGAAELGGRVIYMEESQVQLAKREPIPHAARVLSRYVHFLVVRTYFQDELTQMAAHASIPVINALTDDFHPCQLLADLMTVREKKGDLADLKIAFVGDGNNMAQSWINAAALMGFELRLAVPPGYEPRRSVLDAARARARRPIVLSDDPLEAVEGVDVINTDVWASMGKEGERETRIKAFAAYQVNTELVAAAASGAIVLHCLPAHLGEEITEAVMESEPCVAFDQAENRLHAQKALLEFIHLAE